jgi:hypothetical protein
MVGKAPRQPECAQQWFGSSQARSDAFLRAGRRRRARPRSCLEGVGMAVCAHQKWFHAYPSTLGVEESNAWNHAFRLESCICPGIMHYVWNYAFALESLTQTGGIMPTP